MIPAGADVWRALHSMLGHAPNADFVESGGEILISQWQDASPQPGDADILDHLADLSANPAGQLFSAWLAEHGGDPAKTRKRRAREELDKADGNALLMEVAVAVVLGVLDVVRTQVPTLPDPTPAQVRDRLKTRIGS